MSDLPQSIEAILDHFREALQTIRSGRANPAMIEKVPISAYGSTMTLLELASITTPEPRQLLIQPWDVSTIKDIERGINASDLDLQAIVDGSRLRINLPPMTEERRNEYLKLTREKAEHARVALRHQRDEQLRQLRESERSGALSEDAASRERDTVEKLIKEAVERVGQLVEDKETELKTI